MKMKKFNAKSKRETTGMTLIEVMVVLILLTGTIIAITPVFRQGITMSLHYEDGSTAIAIAQQEMESMRATAFASLASQSAQTVSGFPRYTKTVTVSSIDSTLKQVQVSITWTSAGVAQNYSLSTLRADY